MIGPTVPAVLTAAAGGDEDAFGVLWRDLQPRLLRYFMLIAPGAAEDLAAETWVAIIRAIDRFQGDEAAFRAWVFTIARNKARASPSRSCQRSAWPNRRRPTTRPPPSWRTPRPGRRSP